MVVGARGLGAGRGQQDGARVLGEGGELGVEAGDEEGPLHEHHRRAGDEQHHGEGAGGDDEPAAQGHHGSRIV